MITFDEEHDHNVALTGISAITELAKRLQNAEQMREHIYNEFVAKRVRVEELEEQNAELKAENDSLKVQMSLGPRFVLTDEGKKLACDKETGEED